MGSPATAPHLEELVVGARGSTSQPWSPGRRSCLPWFSLIKGLTRAACRLLTISSRSSAGKAREETSLSAERKGCAFLVLVVQGEHRVLPRVLQVLRTSRVPCLAPYAEENSEPPSPSFPSYRQKFPAQPTPCNAPAPSITSFNGCKKAIHPLSRWRRQGKYQV